MPQAGCRSIALTFNHLWSDRRGMSVGKSFVAKVVRESQREILEKRRDLRSRQPRPMPRNVVWGLDLTFLPDHGDKPPAVLGILDHGTRLCMTLQRLERKTTIAVLRLLLDAIELFGKPRVLRTDNEALFTSTLMRICLAILRIRHQRSAPFAPWQNGRIERFFGTFKRCLRELLSQQASSVVIDRDLDTFRSWYNHLRPHQNLAGRTPTEAWTGRAVNRLRAPLFVTEWSGVLSGFYWPP
jgi:putative transposase